MPVGLFTTDDETILYLGSKRRLQKFQQSMGPHLFGWQDHHDNNDDAPLRVPETEGEDFYWSPAECATILKQLVIVRPSDKMTAIYNRFVDGLRYCVENNAWVVQYSY